ncbi:hypothetical protein [Asanoa siamensis]|nr:hypothetical protein [Asanoa siamensis]
MDADAWRRITAGVDGRDLRYEQVLDEFGTPGLIVSRRVLCYAPPDGSGWVFVDCVPLHRDTYVPGRGTVVRHWDVDPVVRAVRRPAAGFEAGLTLTPDLWLERGEAPPDGRPTTAVHFPDPFAPTPDGRET